MSFLYPAFLLGALAIAIPIVLHLLRRDVAPEVPFSAVRLLRRNPVEQTRRRRLRDWLLLAARVAALLLLAAAFARPYLNAGLDGAPLLVIAVDRSYSMGAPGQFDRARVLARESIQAAGHGASVAVIAFDDRAEIVAEPGGASDALAAISALQPGYGATRYAPLITKADELGAFGPVKLVIVSDMQRSGWQDEEQQLLPANVELELRDVRAVSANLSGTGLARKDDGLAVTISNSGGEPVSGSARLLVNGSVVASPAFVAPAGGTLDVTIAHVLPAAGALTVEIDDPGGYPADNARHLLLDRDAGPGVLVVGSDGAQPGFYVTRALLAGDGDDALDVHPVTSAALARMAPEDLSRREAVVLLSTRGLERRAREMLGGFVRAGGGLLVAGGPDIEPSVLATVLGVSDLAAEERAAGPAVLAATDLRHPIFSPFGPLAANLGQVRFSRAWRLRGDGWNAAARFTDGSPALLERHLGEGTVLIFASDMERRWNDFPLHPAFAPFAREAVRYISATRETRREYLVADVPPAVQREPGVHTVEKDGRRVAINVDARESSSAALSSGEFRAMLQPQGRELQAPRLQQVRQAEAAQNLWQYGLMLMLAVLVIESAVGRARRHG